MLTDNLQLAQPPASMYIPWGRVNAGEKTEDTLNRHQYDFPAITTTAVVTNATHLNRRVERVENVIGGVSAAPIAPCDFPIGATPVRSALTVTVIHLLTLVTPTITNIILRLKKKTTHAFQP